MEALDKILKEESDVELTNVIEVEVSEQVACDRVLGRARGADDNAEVFRNRMSVYLAPLKPIQAFYTAKGILHKINGERTIEEIVSEMEGFIKSRL